MMIAYKQTANAIQKGTTPLKTVAIVTSWAILLTTTDSMSRFARMRSVPVAAEMTPGSSVSKVLGKFDAV